MQPSGLKIPIAEHERLARERSTTWFASFKAVMEETNFVLLQENWLEPINHSRV